MGHVSGLPKVSPMSSTTSQASATDAAVLPATSVKANEVAGANVQVQKLLETVKELEVKLRQMHESCTLLWSETADCRQLQTRHHEILTNLTRIVSKFHPEETGNQVYSKNDAMQDMERNTDDNSHSSKIQEPSQRSEVCIFGSNERRDQRAGI